MGIAEMKRAVFLDRDGVLNPLCGLDALGNPESPLTLSDFQIFPFVGESVKLLNEEGYLVIIATNQPAYAKGKMELEDLKNMHNALQTHIEECGGRIDRIYCCLHHDDPNQVVKKIWLKECGCRKPKPGMLLRAATDLNVDLKKSWMIGDSWKDVIAGQKAGCKTILISPERDKLLRCKPSFSAKDLVQAVEIIREEK